MNYLRSLADVLLQALSLTPSATMTIQRPKEDLPPFDHASASTYTEPPTPGWTLAQPLSATPEGRAWLAGEKQGWEVVHADDADPYRIYQLMVGGVVPRPIAFVSSVSAEGVENVAPFSWFNMVTSDPPVISLGLLHHQPTADASALKDTAANILATRGFTVNLVSEPFAQHANACSVNAPPHASEWALSGLTRAPSIYVAAPRVKESAFSMECELYAAHPITHPVTGLITTTLVLGRVRALHIRRDTLDARGRVDTRALRPVAKMGDISYARVGGLFRAPRPEWADAERVLAASAAVDVRESAADAESAS